MNNSENMKKIWQAIDNVKTVIKGKDESLEKCMCVLLAGGHILMEDIPGVGKTTLALAFSKALSLKQKRMQFTPDVLPSDVTGYHILQKETGKYVYYPGAVMCNLFLADEINRTSPKTQSALLEVMEEGTVTIDAVRREVPQPFMVIATENPTGSSGTQMLPESQMDRFMIRMSIGYPKPEDEISMLKSKKEMSVDDIQPTLTVDEILEMKKEVEQVYMHDLVYQYLVNLVNATRHHQLLALGVSPRGTIALARMASAHAYMSGRDYVIPDDISAVFQDVCQHRIILNTKARVGNVTAEEILDQILAAIEKPKAKKG
ncbi:MAG: AAA family ATPase [Lachnospiraceae bacterium]|jgi:MoxR-like ATPase